MSASLLIPVLLSRDDVGMDEVHLGGPFARVVLRCARRLSNGAAELLSVTIEDSDLTAGRDVWEGYSDGFSALADYFQDLANHWRVGGTGRRSTSRSSTIFGW
jgi:hypothetical protein